MRTLGPALALALAAIAASPAVLAQKPGPPLGKKAAEAAKKKADDEAAAKAAADKAAAEQAAADKKAADDAAAAEREKSDQEAAERAKKEKAAADQKAAEEAAALEHDPNEDPTKTYRFIGIRFRDVIVPKFILNLFASGGTTVNVPMVGVEYGSRRDHLEYDLALQYAPYSMGPTLFKGKNDASISYEKVESGLKLAYFTFDLLYEIPLEKQGDKTGRFALLVGGGVGIGAVFGNLYRNQVYPIGDPNNLDAKNWGYCTAPGKPRGDYCDSGNNHYPGSGSSDPRHSENSWANGGSKPMVFPWLSLPQVSFRAKPIKELQLRADVGFSITGFFFGAVASYGL